MIIVDLNGVAGPVAGAALDELVALRLRDELQKELPAATVTTGVAPASVPANRLVAAGLGILVGGLVVYLLVS